MRGERRLTSGVSVTISTPRTLAPSKRGRLLLCAPESGRRNTGLSFYFACFAYIHLEQEKKGQEKGMYVLMFYVRR